MSSPGPPLWTPPSAQRGDGFDVVGVGQVSFDHVCSAPALPRVGGKVRALEYARLPGGQVATTLLACARLGLRAAFVGTVGDDAEGAAVLAPLRAGGVDLSSVRTRPGAPTQMAQIWIEQSSGERAIVWFRDPRLSLRPDEIPAEVIRSARALHLDAGDPAASRAAARAAREAGVPVVLDADHPEPGVEALLPEIDFPVVSREFAETFYETSKLEEALERMLAGGARMAVVTLGAAGALARVGERLIRSPAYRVQARDTTGAGDAFRAGFVWGLLEGLDAEGVLRAAAAVAALNCRALGAQGGLPDRAGLLAFLARERPGPWTGPTGVGRS